MLDPCSLAPKQITCLPSSLTRTCVATVGANPSAPALADKATAGAETPPDLSQ